MLNKIIDRVKLPFRKDKELYLSLYNIIGKLPHNIELYKTALLHKSVSRRNNKGKLINNERLEFLGDAILDAVVGDIVFNYFQGKREGFLTNTRSKIVQRETLNRLSKDLGINKLILSNSNSIAAHNSYLAGNAFEALVGALYLDHGYMACMYFIKKQILGNRINLDKIAHKEVNFKSRILEWAQKNKLKIEFVLVENNTDSDGSPTFKFKTIIEGVNCGEGYGYSKKESHQDAAHHALIRIRSNSQFVKQLLAAEENRILNDKEIS